MIGLSICLTPILIAFYLYGLNKGKGLDYFFKYYLFNYIILLLNLGRMLKAKAKYSTFYKTLFKLYLLGSQQRIALVLFAIPLYLFVGPWYVGHVLTGHIGIGFVWGIYIKGTNFESVIFLNIVLN